MEQNELLEFKNDETRKGAKKCAEWLSYCLNIGWDKKHLDELEKIWLIHHDKNGNLKQNKL